MNVQFYWEKLQTSENFKFFLKENPDAFLCSGFFVIDKSGKDNKQHFDFCISDKKKIFSFEIENNNQKNKIDLVESKIPEKLEMDFEFDFTEIEKMIEDEMEKQKIKNQIQKMIFSLQSKEGRPFIIGTIFISGLGLLKIQIDIREMKIVEFEKKSFFDMLKKVK